MIFARTKQFKVRKLTCQFLDWVSTLDGEKSRKPKQILSSDLKVWVVWTTIESSMKVVSYVSVSVCVYLCMKYFHSESINNSNELAIKKRPNKKLHNHLKCSFSFVSRERFDDLIKSPDSFSSFILAVEARSVFNMAIFNLNFSRDRKLEIHETVEMVVMEERETFQSRSPKASCGAFVSV